MTEVWEGGGTGKGEKVGERKGSHLRCSFTSPMQPSCITSLYLRWFPMSNLVFLLFVDNHDNANPNNLFFLFKLLLDPETLLSVGCPSSYKSSWGGISKLWSHEKSPKWMEWILAHFLSTHCLFSPPGFKPMSFLCCFPVTLYHKFSLAHILILNAFLLLPFAYLFFCVECCPALFLNVLIYLLVLSGLRLFYL